MNIVAEFEKKVLAEIKLITNYNKINWGKVQLNRGDIDFYEEGLDVTFKEWDSGNRYKFWYAYDDKSGGLFKINVVDNEQQLTELWSVNLPE